jgi:AraC-like DNA-binding protein
MPGDRGANRLLAQLLRGYWREHSRGLDEQAGCRISVVILDMIAAVYAELPLSLTERPSLGAAHRIRIMNYIQAHLDDPSLTPTGIAGACRITPRYLHHVFEEQDETVSRFILRRRLDSCARALESKAQQHRTITAIAFDHGFNSPTHFGRVFRNRFNMTPKEYRREKGGIG